MKELDIDKNYKLFWQVGKRDKKEANYLLLLHCKPDSSNVFILGITENMEDEECFLEEGFYHFKNPFSNFILSALANIYGHFENVTNEYFEWSGYESIEVRDRINFEKNIGKKQEYIMKKVQIKLSFLIDKVQEFYYQIKSN